MVECSYLDIVMQDSKSSQGPMEASHFRTHSCDVTSVSSVMVPMVGGAHQVARSQWVSVDVEPYPLCVLLHEAMLA